MKVEKSFMVDRVEIPFMGYQYVLQLDSVTIFVDPELVSGCIFTEKFDVVFPCAGRITHISDVVYAIIGVSPSYTDYRLFLLPLDDAMNLIEEIKQSGTAYVPHIVRIGEWAIVEAVPSTLPPSWLKNEEDDYDDYDDYDD